MPACRPRLMHWPANPTPTGAGGSPAIRLQHRVGGLRAERPRGLAAHPERPVRRRRRVPGRDDALVVHAGQRLVGEQAAQGVGAQPAAGGQIRYAEAGGPDGHRARQLAAVAELHGIAASPGHPARRALEHGHPELGQPAGHRRRPRGCRYGPSTPPQTRVTARPGSASSAAVSMPVGPAPTTVTGAVAGAASRTARSRSRLLQAGDRVGELGRSGHAGSALPLPTA